jgi:23S rRNA (pseudouridine1915-N3)-methyltransferase
MEIKLITVSSNKQEWSDLAAETYCEKINHHIKFKEEILKSKKLEREDSQKKIELESQAILNAIKPDEFVVLCDEKGKSFSSIEFSKKLVSTFESGKRSVVFVVGGSETLSKSSSADSLARPRIPEA